MLSLPLDAAAPSSELAAALVVICSTRSGLAGIPVCRVRQVVAPAAGDCAPGEPMDGRPWLAGIFRCHDEPYQIIDLDRVVAALQD